MFLCRARRRTDRDGGAVHARRHGAARRGEHDPGRPAARRAERPAQHPITNSRSKRLRPGDDGRRARQRVPAERRAAGIPDRLHENQVDARRVKPFFVSIIALLLASTAAAQSTRVDTIAEQQAEKAKELSPEGPSDAERIIRQVLLSPLLSGGDGVYPWFGSVYGGSGMGLGVGYLKRLENASYINLQTGISINTSMVIRGTFAAPELWRGMLQVDANIQWLDAHDVAFYGYGQDSSKETRDSYDFNPFELSTNLTFKPIRHVFMTASYAYTPI